MTDLGPATSGRGFRLVAAVLLGALCGLALMTAHVSRAASYLDDAPETCMNCHVMTAAYESWQHGSHREVATCVDCHVPHDNLVGTYAFKASDGLRHATVFTLRREPQVLRLSAGALPVVEGNCLRCHGDLVDGLHLARREAGAPRCWDCHRETPHGRVHSLSGTPGQLRPRLPGMLDLQHEATQGGRQPRSVPSSTHHGSTSP